MRVPYHCLVPIWIHAHAGGLYRQITGPYLGQAAIPVKRQGRGYGAAHQPVDVTCQSRGLFLVPVQYVDGFGASLCQHISSCLGSASRTDEDAVFIAYPDSRNSFQQSETIGRSDSSLTVPCRIYGTFELGQPERQFLFQFQKVAGGG